MLPESLGNPGPPWDTADSIAPLQTEPSPFQTSKFLHRCRLHSVFHVPVVEPLRVRPQT